MVFAYCVDKKMEMEKKETYLDLLLNKSEDELAIEKKMAEESARFECTYEYIEHEKRMKALQEELAVYRDERLLKAKNERAERIPVKPTNQEFEVQRKKVWDSYSIHLKAALEAYEILNDDNKRKFELEISKIWPHSYYKTMENAKTNHDDLSDLQKVLVQTVLDFAHERGLEDMFSIRFHVDDIPSSVKEREWTCFSDSYLSAYGLTKENELMLIDEVY